MESLPDWVQMEAQPSAHSDHEVPCMNMSGPVAEDEVEAPSTPERKKRTVRVFVADRSRAQALGGLGFRFSGLGFGVYYLGFRV